MPMLEFAKLSAAAFETLSREKTIFFFPVGPLEDHGPHLPMGLDLAHATRLAQLTAERMEREMPEWKCVLMPSVALGIDSDTSSLAIRVRAHVLRDWLVDCCKSLVREGFQYFVCYSGHSGPRQLSAIEEAGKLLSRWHWHRPRRKRPMLISASSALVTWKDFARAPMWVDAQEHGGKIDTSVALAIAPAVVDGMREALPPMEAPGRGLSRWWRMQRGEVNGYWGAPGEASREVGEASLGETVDTVWPKLRAVLESGANPRFLFRSWYGILPPNRSLFRAWLLALVIALIVFLTLWVNQWALQSA